MFQSMCDELKDWIGEKNSQLGIDDLGRDLNTVQALQRKHQVGSDSHVLFERFKKKGQDK